MDPFTQVRRRGEALIHECWNAAAESKGIEFNYFFIFQQFSQRMLEKAEQRSRALGICSTNASKFPCGDANTTSSSSMASSTSNVAACTTTMALASQQQAQQKQQLPLHTTNSSAGNINKLVVVEKPGTMEPMALDKAGGCGGVGGSPRKVLRHFSAVDKENVDLGIEINIMTNENVEVRV